jgi:hypothetical protein
LTTVQDDLDRLEAVETVEELKDVYQHFLLYHGRQLPASQEFHRKKVPYQILCHPVNPGAIRQCQKYWRSWLT